MELTDTVFKEEDIGGALQNKSLFQYDTNTTLVCWIVFSLVRMMR